VFLPFDDLNFDLTIATVSSGDEAVLPQFLPTMLLLSPLFCLAVLQLSPKRRLLCTPFWTPTQHQCFSFGKEKSKRFARKKSAMHSTMRCYRALGWQLPNAVSQRKAQAVCSRNPWLLQQRCNKFAIWAGKRCAYQQQISSYGTNAKFGLRGQWQKLGEKQA
jgi:hypothetical protein